MSFAPDQILQNADWQKLARALALAHDSRDAKVVVQNLDRVADLDVFRLGEQVVDESVVRSLERSALKIVKWTEQAFVTFQIDAGDDFQSAIGGNLGDDGSDGHHVRQLLPARRRF